MAADPSSDTLRRLVEHYSPSGAEAPAVSWLVGRMRTLGYTQAFADAVAGIVDPGYSNAVGVMGTGPHQIVLLGHIDTVPGEIPVRIEDGILYGRGAVDAKGPLAAFVDAVARIGPQPGWQMVVIGAVDEERESVGARSIVDRYRPEFAIIGEPNQWDRVALGYKGTAWAEITVRQPLAHTAAAVRSACENSVELWGKVRAWVDVFNVGRERVFDQVLLTLRGMNSGEDGFEEWGRLRVGARLPVDLPPEAWYARLAEIIAGTGFSAGAEVAPQGFPVPAYQAEKNTPLVRAFLAGIRALGGKPSFVLKTGTADLNIVAPVWGCPAVVYGPGDSALDHTPNEHLALSDYARAVDVLVAALKNITAR